MPFKSVKQRGFLFRNKPDVALDFVKDQKKETPQGPKQPSFPGNNRGSVYANLLNKMNKGGY